MSVEALVIPDRATVQTEAFKRQSVTSERWLQLLEVTRPDLMAFLLERKAAGYMIVGEWLNQTLLPNGLSSGPPASHPCPTDFSALSRPSHPPKRSC
jgi:hypothetical protein